MKAPRLSLLASHLALKAGVPSHLDLIVRVSAPASKSSAPRPSISLALVIDSSGSMDGPPLEQAKAAAAHLVGRLSPGDQACVVTYGARTQVLVEPVDAVAGRARLLAAIEGIRSAGGTPLRAGWLLGAQALAPTVSKFALSRVLLLSDGQATDGSIPAILEEEARELAASGIGTSTYGLGRNFNEALMTQLARGGQGQAFYAESAEALVPYFQSEFQMLAATVGQQVQAQVKALAGGQEVEVQRLDTLAPACLLDLPALVAGADAWVGVRVPVPALAPASTVDVQVKVSWRDMDGKAHVRTQALSVPVRAREKAGTDAWGLERIKEVAAARAQREALESARCGDWARTEVILRGVAASAGDNAYVAAVAGSLAGLSAERDLNRLSKEVAYSSYSMSSRLVDQAEVVSELGPDRLGLRKACQGKAAPGAKGPDDRGAIDGGR